MAAADERWHRVAADADGGGSQKRPERQRLVLSPRVVVLAERLDALRTVLLALDGAADNKNLSRNCGWDLPKFLVNDFYLAS